MVTVDEKKFFTERLTDVWVYPKVCSYNDSLANSNDFFSFLDSPPREPAPTRIYIHIPFCDSYCPFCPYYKVPYKGQSESWKNNYFEAVCKELSMYAQSNFFKNIKISTIYFGGGDPAVVELKYMRKIFETIYAQFNMSECAGISVEGNIKSLLDEDKLSFYEKQKVTRISFGIQTFKPELRKKLQLKPTEDELNALVKLIKKHDFEDFSVDLIYNLPDQTMDDLRTDLMKTFALSPHYIDVYNLNLYPNTRFKEIVESGNKFKIVPTNKREIEMFREIQKKMQDNQYNQVASMCFSYKSHSPHIGFERFLKTYPMLAVGPSARGYLEGYSYRNSCSVDDYADKLHNSHFPAEAGNYADKSMRDEKIMVFFPVLTKIHKDEIPDYKRFENNINILLAAGMVEWQNDYLVLTDEGKIWTGNIQRFFYSSDVKKKDLNTLINAMKYKKNPYNQDDMGVLKNTAP